MNQSRIFSDNTQKEIVQDSPLNSQIRLFSDNDFSQTNERGGLEFVFNYAENIPQEIKDSMENAGEIWSSWISDDVTVKIDVGFESSEQFLAFSNNNSIEVTYSEFFQALQDDVVSEDDAIALFNLPDENDIDLLINNTRENRGSDEAYLDTNDSKNNSTLLISTANAKALGLLLDVENDITDARITVSDSMGLDFNPVDGISPDAYDFQSIAVHEIGHALGFISSVDALDRIAGNNLRELIASGDVDPKLIIEVLGWEDLVTQFDLEAIVNIDLEELIAGSFLEPILENVRPDLFVSEDFYTPSPVDLFRYSDRSSDLGVIDFTTGGNEKYFSLDGGYTPIAEFSTGEFLGHGGQTDHWQDDLGTGIMDPTLPLGEESHISYTDLQLLDVIGWDVV